MMEDNTPIITFFPDETYGFYDESALNKDPFENKMRHLIDSSVSMGPFQHNDDVFVIFYHSTPKHKNEKINPIGVRFAGHITCGCGLDEHHEIFGQVGFIKYHDGIKTIINDNDIEWLRTYNNAPITNKKSRCCIL